MTTTTHVSVGPDNRPDSKLTREQIIARNLIAVEAHFHNETPESIETAIDLYGDSISWEGPNRGIVLKDPKQVLQAYRGIFKTISIQSFTPIRRFATEQFVFDDQIILGTVVGNEMPNLKHPVGTKLSVRMAHCFEMKDGKIVREVAYEMFRLQGSPEAVDDIPEGSGPIKAFE